MRTYDFGIGWPSSDNRDLFVKVLEAECKAHKMSFITANEKNLDELTREIKKGQVKVKFFLDMASDTYNLENPFTRFIYTLKDSGTKVVADPDDVKSAADKSITHFDLVNAGIPVPYTIVIRHWEPSRNLTTQEKDNLGTPFVIKPALGYGQFGVKIITQKNILEDINQARQFNPGDNFLLQEFVQPLTLPGGPAWFRTYNLFGEIIPCWWNPETKEYNQVTLKEMDDHKLMPLVRLTSEIARITHIDWFSCEIAIAAKNKKFVVIDYMNDQCAIWPKSVHKDGVPDELIVHIGERMVDKAWQYIRGKFTRTYRAVWFPKIKEKDENA